MTRNQRKEMQDYLGRVIRSGKVPQQLRVLAEDIELGFVDFEKIEYALGREPQIILTLKNKEETPS